MNNINMDAIMSMLSKMDKKDLEEGMKMANEILKNKNTNDNMDTKK